MRTRILARHWHLGIATRPCSRLSRSGPASRFVRGSAPSTIARLRRARVFCACTWVLVPYGDVKIYTFGGDENGGRHPQPRGYFRCAALFVFFCQPFPTASRTEGHNS